MSDQVILSSGARPWLPTADTEAVEMLSYYDGPLIGIFRQHGVAYLFRCLGGELAAANLWLYSPLTEADVSAILASEGTEFDSLLDRVSEGLVTVALASDQDGLLHWQTEDTHGMPSDELPQLVVKRLGVSLERLYRQATALASNF